MPLVTFREIQRFCDEKGFEPSNFGRQAIKDPSLYRAMKNGRELRQSTSDRIRAFMDGFQ